jgi:lipid-A-disaccharide synthase
MKKYFVFAGEASGDLHGSRLIQALLEDENAISICGVGGPRMRKEKFECFLPMEEFQVMGFSDVLRSLPHLWKLFYKVRDFILKTKPDCVILIDYPGFNLRLAQALRKQGFSGKLVQYICPSVWAHGKKRIEVLNHNYDLLLTIFPFEADCFAGKPLRVEYVGNPLVENIHTHHYHSDWVTQMGLPPDQELIALFPGSRLGEIRRHIPQQLTIAAQIKRRYPKVHFALSCAQESLREPLLNLILQGPLRLNHDLHIISPQYHYDLMKHCKTALAKSGTVTLELALHCTPTVVHYEVSPLNYLIAKYILRLRLPHYCIVNILGNQTIFPEFIGRGLSTDAIMKNLEQLQFDSLQHQSIRKACEALKEQLGHRPSHQSAAKAIQEIIKD